jgi:hypothetical protein
MITLNGKKYYEKKDVQHIFSDAIYFTSNPSGNMHEFLFLVDDEEKDVIIEGITALNNTIMWEFVNESAINFNTIQSCYFSLRNAIPASNMMDFKSFRQMNSHSLSTSNLVYYENWLRNCGYNIFFNLFKNL